MHKFWTLHAAELFERLHSSPSGLSCREASKRLKKWGDHLLNGRKQHTASFLFFGQFKSPLILLLLFASALSLILGNRTDALIIFLIVGISGLLSFFQEIGARNAVEKLLALVKVKVLVIRDGQSLEVARDQIVPGDVILLSAGDMVPGDCLLLESKDCFLDEATLTGEPFSVEKRVGVIPENTPLSRRSNVLYLGSHVVSGTAKALVVQIGRDTEFGKISERLKFRPPETAFELGIRHFGYLLMEVTLIFVIAIFAFNIYLHRPVIESFLFAVALAVGFTPQLLPAIVSMNLSHGARRMALGKVIVKRLSSIENLGAMEVLCSDKTGTLTQGVIALNGACDVECNTSAFVHLLAHLNALFQTGYSNPIDKAILDAKMGDVNGYEKLDEIPYDFIRKRLTVLVKGEQGKQLITKGAFSTVLKCCSRVRISSEQICSMEGMEEKLESSFEEYCLKGYRTLAIAYKSVEKGSIVREDEEDLIFAGFLLFYDPPKQRIKEVLEKIDNAKVGIKILTGDHSLVAVHIAQEIGFLPPKEGAMPMKDYLMSHVLTGEQIHNMSNRALIRQVLEKSIFAELEPHQKERIILALRKAGIVVGYLGDGVNDATALHAADVGISVEKSTDVVKEVADIVLLKKDLSVLLGGIQEGRKTFANTMKYIFMATSANFGNMFSMAGISLVIPFLPLLPKQILFTNLLTDVPEMAIATDSVDEEIIESPVKWDMGFIRRFMIVFGLISSLFDFATFGVLLHILKAYPDEFRTGWFMESVVSAAMIVLVVRTRKVFWKSQPSNPLTIGVFAIVVFTLFLPLTPLAKVFGFVPLPASFYWTIALIVAFYVAFAEIAKKFFYRGYKKQETVSKRVSARF